MEGKDIAHTVVEHGLQRLESAREAIERYALECGEIVARTRQELEAVEQASQVGQSQTFLGASVMLVGVTEYPLQKPQFESREGRLVSLHVDGTMHQVPLHGDPAALRALSGRYKVIVLLYATG